MPLKRSTINTCIETALTICTYFDFKLPPFAYWKVGEWDSKKGDFSEIQDCMLGWDVTDFGSNNFERIGRVLFTLRNGKSGSKIYPKEYAEKLLIDPENQRAPAHFHRTKREDIICRAGGNILVQLFQATPEGKPSDKNLTVNLDGKNVLLNPGEIVRLVPGTSITINPYTIHQFWGEEGTGYQYNGVGYTLSSEISSVCDDLNDNVFLGETSTRFPSILEDQPQKYYLCHEYLSKINP